MGGTSTSHSVEHEEEHGFCVSTEHYKQGNTNTLMVREHRRSMSQDEPDIMPFGRKRTSSNVSAASATSASSNSSSSSDWDEQVRREEEAERKSTRLSQGLLMATDTEYETDSSHSSTSHSHSHHSSTSSSSEVVTSEDSEEETDTQRVSAHHKGRGVAEMPRKLKRPSISMTNVSKNVKLKKRKSGSVGCEYDDEHIRPQSTPFRSSRETAAFLSKMRMMRDTSSLSGNHLNDVINGGLSMVGLHEEWPD